MNKEYMLVALYHTVINHQLELIIEGLEELGEYNPKMYEVKAHMEELGRELEDEGRRLLERIEKEYEEKDKKD